MQKVCANGWCKQTFEVTDGDLAFYDEISPVFGGQKFSIPPPTLCPQCRLQRRMQFRNERHLYKRTSDLSGKPIVSTFAPDSPYKVFDQQEWWSDAWDALDYGQDIDPQKDPLEQLRLLNLAVPHPSLNTTNVENSEYTNYALNVRNSYLCFGVTNTEDCLYGKFVIGCKDAVDCLSLYSCERCYEGVASQQCYGCAFFSYCQNCSDCFLVEDCLSSKDCLLCFGLRNKQYCIQNKQFDRATFEQRKRELLADLTHERLEGLCKEFARFVLQFPHRAMNVYASEGCSGDMIFNSKNCHDCFDIKDGEDCKYVAFTPKGVGSYDSTFTSPDGVQWSYEAMSSLGQRCLGTYLCWFCHDTQYSIECKSCRNVFGCVGLRNKQYCIFNKQYAKEEYEALVPQLIGRMMESGAWGEFLPVSLSQFAYDETIAEEYFPLSKEDAVARGWRWRGTEDGAPLGATLSADALPKTIRETTDSLLDVVVRSAVSGRPFKFLKKEIAFYRSMGLPLPHRSPDERHDNRLQRKNPYRLWDRQCAKCQKGIQTTYAPDRPEIVYCEGCYLKEVY